MCVAPELHYVKFKDGLGYRLSRYGFARYYIPSVSSLYREMYDSGNIVSACFRCSECLKRRRNSIGYCLEKEFEKSDSCLFVTFTYNEDNIPIARRSLSVDIETGELCYGLRGESLDDCDVPDVVRQGIKNFYSRNNSKPRYFQYDLPELDDHIVRLVYTPSLRRRDFSKFIKDSREDFYYYNKGRLNFKYWCIGEMGPRTCRPHMHAVFFNLTEELFNKYFKDHWPYGDIHLKVVPKLYTTKSGDIVDGFVHLGRYLGKYMAKGVLECPSVKDGFAEKPRIISSLNVGNDVSSAMSDYLFMYDMVGRYDPYSLVKEDGTPLSEKEFIQMSREFSRRRRYYVNGYPFSLPSNIVNRVRRFSCKFNGKFIQYETIPIFKILSQIAQTRALGLLDKAFFRSQKRDSQGLFVDDGSSFWIRQEARRKASLQSIVASDVIHYSRSFC